MGLYYTPAKKGVAVMSLELKHDYYFKPIKIIRDLVHGYINLTEFDIKIMGTLEFQRLKDIKQLTCQQVYPSAQHTRFEHSLGVLELMRNSLKHLNKNGILFGPKNATPLFGDQLVFNASIAALLHDVGHCPFSHLGETLINKKEVWNRLCDDLTKLNLSKDLDLQNRISKEKEPIGQEHEILSCIMILEKFFGLLNQLDVFASSGDKTCKIKTDFEFIIRCILGIKYKVDTTELYQKYRLYNVVISLLNSESIDMDKLDYIMRDALMTGIGTPRIDTKRLFRNMFLSKQYTLIFTSKAVPALQNMIDSRDGLYMYVYNHQTAVFSDYMNKYIVRKLNHNTSRFLKAIYSLKKPNTVPIEEFEEVQQENLIISGLAMVPKNYVFSIDAVIEQYASDSNWLSLLNIIYDLSKQYGDRIEEYLLGEIQNFGDFEITTVKTDESAHMIISDLVKQIEYTYQLIENYKKRNFLKPWWKTLIEFNAFMEQNFQDDKIRNELCEWICHDNKKINRYADEVRSQISKHSIFILKRLQGLHPDIVTNISDDHFFIADRQTRFFDPKTIEKIDIALNTNNSNEGSTTSDYYVKTLTNIIPQKNYSSIYTQNSFYVYSKVNNKIKGYKEILEKIFVFVSIELVLRGEVDFVEKFYYERDKKIQAENASMTEMYNKFVSVNPNYK